MRIEPEIGGADVIVLGDLDPELFTPVWFVRHGLLPKSVADGAGIALTPPPVMEFTNDHYPIGETSPTTGRPAGILEENFDASLKRSNDIIDHVMSLAKEQET